MGKTTVSDMPETMTENHDAHSRGSWQDATPSLNEPDNRVPLPPEKPLYRETTPIENFIAGAFGGKNAVRESTKNNYGQPYKTRGQ